MEHVDARLAALELAVTELRAHAAELTELRTLVGELETRLAAERTRIRTMRHTLQCPSCGGRRILHFRTVNQTSDYGLIPLSLTTQYSAWSGTKEGEPLQAFVCRNCGLLEWHATGLERVKPDGDTIVELAPTETAPPPSDPYR